MRIIFIILFLGGLTVGLIYPWAQRHFSGEEIGSWPLYDRGQGYQTVQVDLQPEDAPLRIFVDATPMPGYSSANQGSSFNLAVLRDGVPFLAERLNYSIDNGSAQRNQPQTGGVLRQGAEDLPELRAGKYEFSIRAGAVDGLQVTHADLVLRRGVKPLSENLTTAGVIAMVIGLYGFMRLRRRAKNLAQ